MPTIPYNNPSPASLQREIDALKREIRLLKEKPQAEDNPSQAKREITFTHVGLVAIGVSPNYLVKDFQGTIHRVDWTAVVPGTTASTLDLRVNGSTVLSLTLPAGDDSGTEQGLAIEVEEYDKVSVNVSTVGTSINGLSVALRMTVLEDEEA